LAQRVEEKKTEYVLFVASVILCRNKIRLSIEMHPTNVCQKAEVAMLEFRGWSPDAAAI